MSYLKPAIILCSIFAIAKVIAIKAKDTLLFHPEPVNRFDTYETITTYKKELRRDINKDIVLQEIVISDNKIKLNAILFDNPRNNNWMVFSHGNSGNIWTRLDLIKTYGKHCSIILYDYQGFGKSNGSPSESSLFNSIRTVWNYLTITLNINHNNITLMGSSLGCSPTLWLGKELTNNKTYPKCIILRSPFSSVKDMANQIVPSIITTVLLPSEFNNKEYIKSINKTPIQIYHSKTDEVIPYNQAVELANYGNADFYEISGGHNYPVFNSYCKGKIIDGIRN